jgi:hypothetical protein
MKHIRLYTEYTTERIDRVRSYQEAISGTEVPIPLNGKGSYFGSGYGDTISPKTIDQHDTKTIYSRKHGIFYTEDMFQDIYQKFISMPEYRDLIGKDGIQLSDFTEENIDIILGHIQDN